MSTFYEDMQATAAELIAEFGMPMTLLRPKGDPDGVEGELAGEGQTSLATKGIFLSMTVSNVRESLAEGAERLCLIDASVAPDLADLLQVGARKYGTVRIDEINPAGTPLAYVLHLRH